MEKILRMLVTCLLLSAASMAHGTQQAPPASSEHSAPSMQQDSQPGSMASSANKGDKIISGCLRSKNGKCMLEVNTTRRSGWRDPRTSPRTWAIPWRSTAASCLRQKHLPLGKVRTFRRKR